MVAVSFVFSSRILAREISPLSAASAQIPCPALPFSLFSESSTTTKESATMEWTTPQHEEIELNCEVSSYANAEI